jgi:hypothetical protein
MAKEQMSEVLGSSSIKAWNNLNQFTQTIRYNNKRIGSIEGGRHRSKIDIEACETSLMNVKRNKQALALFEQFL